jgi:hypothetical protein
MPAISMNLNVNPVRIAQIALGGAAVFGGYKAASSMIRTAFREDLIGDPTRVVEIDDKTMIYQTREPQGAKLTNFTLGAGAAAAFAGGALVMGAPAGATGLKAMLRSGGGAALFALGVGAIAGATAIAAQYNGSDFEPVR